MTNSAESDVETLERRLDALEDAVEELEETMSTATNRDLPLLIGAVRALVDADIEGVDELPDAGRSFHRRCADREKRLHAVEAQLDTLGETDAARSTKAEKYGAILAFAQNKRNGTAKVAVSPSEIKGCTGVSRRYAYDLLEAMAEEIEGVGIRESRQVKTGSGVKQKGKALLVDCEAVHGETDGVNEFTTDGGEYRGE